MKKPKSPLNIQIQGLLKQKTIESSIQYFLKTLHPSPYLYFEWLSRQYALKLLHSHPSTPSQSIRLYESDPDFHINQLYQPQNISILKSIAQKIIPNHNLLFELITVKDQPFGIVGLTETNSDIKSLLYCLQSKCESLVWKQQCVKFSNYDYFLKILYSEISRSRRLSLPVSLILIDCISYPQIKKDHNCPIFFKSLYNHLLKNNRMYDSLIQISPKEIACILPHTSEKGAVEKAQKIDWILKSLKSSKFFKKEIQFKIAVAVYPSVARDALGLIHIARKSCQEEGRAVCVATASPAFQPDFSSETKLDSLRELT